MSSRALMAERVDETPHHWVPPDRHAAAAPGAATTVGMDPERLLLDAAALRRRQLCVAFLHGSSRSWRVRRRTWPGAVAGLLIVAVVIAAMAVAAAFAAQQDIDGKPRLRGAGEVTEHVLSGQNATRFPVIKYDRSIATLQDVQKFGHGLICTDLR